MNSYNNYRSRAEFEDYVKSLGYKIEFTDKFKDDSRFYHVEHFHYNDDAGVYVGRDKFGCISLESVDDKGNKRILDFIVTLTRGVSMIYNLYWLNDMDYNVFAGYQQDENGNLILDEHNNPIPIYFNTKGSISEVGSTTLKQEETYIGADPENLYVFTYYGYLLIKEFLMKQTLTSTKITCI